MALFEKMIPFILFFECGVKKEYLNLPAEKIFAQARKTGYVYDPADAGGHTMCGVTLSTYRRYKKGATVADLMAMPFDHWVYIFKKMFWDKWRADEIEDQSVANMVVDWMWEAARMASPGPKNCLA